MTTVSIIIGREAVSEHYKHGFRKFIKQNKNMDLLFQKSVIDHE